jgi:hypothetical protein
VVQAPTWLWNLARTRGLWHPRHMLWTVALSFLVGSVFGPVGSGQGVAPHRGNLAPRVASVESRVERDQLALPDPKGALREDLAAAIATIDWRAERVPESVVLSAVLAEGGSSRTKDGVVATFRVELVVRDARGAILGTVAGKASGRDAKGSRQELEAGVLSAASESAARAIPEAVRRARRR